MKIEVWANMAKTKVTLMSAFLVFMCWGGVGVSVFYANSVEAFMGECWCPTPGGPVPCPGQVFGPLVCSACGMSALAVGMANATSKSVEVTFEIGSRLHELSSLAADIASKHQKNSIQSNMLFFDALNDKIKLIVAKQKSVAEAADAIEEAARTSFTSQIYDAWRRAGLVRASNEIDSIFGLQSTSYLSESTEPLVNNLIRMESLREDLHGLYVNNFNKHLMPPDKVFSMASHANGLLGDSIADLSELKGDEIANIVLKDGLDDVDLGKSLLTIQSLLSFYPIKTVVNEKGYEARFLDEKIFSTKKEMVFGALASVLSERSKKNDVVGEMFFDLDSPWREMVSITEDGLSKREFVRGLSRTMLLSKEWFDYISAINTTGLERESIMIDAFNSFLLESVYETGQKSNDMAALWTLEKLQDKTKN